MHQPNHNDEDFFDLLARPEGVVPKNKNFEASPLTLGEKVARHLPSQHKDPERKAGQERGLALTIDTLNNFLIPKTPTDAALTMLPIGALGKVAKKGLKQGKRHIEKMYKPDIFKPMPFQRASKHRAKEAFQIDPKDKKGWKEYNLKYGEYLDRSKPDKIVDYVGMKAGVFTNPKKYPKIDVNETLFKRGQKSTYGKLQFLQDKTHVIKERVSHRLGSKLDIPKKENVLYHEFDIKPIGGSPLKDEIAGLSFTTRRIKNKADRLEYGPGSVLVENLNFSSGIRTPGRGGAMGFTRQDLSLREDLAADKGTVKLLLQAFERLPKSAVVSFDNLKDNTMTREALLLMINSAGKMAKRIIFNQRGPTRVRPNYEIQGSGKGLDQLSDSEFAERILQSVEKANRKGKVSGKLVVESDNIKNNWIKMSSLRIELAAAFGVPLSQFNNFMEKASEE
tara:strand:- start:397 stop:1746 length:1350 start_codon:yes stop_codon:yes gene_type:complete